MTNSGSGLEIVCLQFKIALFRLFCQRLFDSTRIWLIKWIKGEIKEFQIGFYPSLSANCVFYFNMLYE